MNWLRQAISNDKGMADMAYLAIGVLTTAACFALTFICTMSAISYHLCGPVTTVVNSTSHQVTTQSACTFDPLPVGQAAGLIFGAFATLIGALAGYMAATGARRNGVSGVG